MLSDHAAIHHGDRAFNEYEDDHDESGPDGTARNGLAVLAQLRISVSWPLGGLAALGVVGGIETALDAVIGGAAAGVVIGGVQWLALRSRFALSPWWIAATGAGMAAGLATSVALQGIDTASNALLVRGTITGLVLGFAQWLVLRRCIANAAIWIPTIAIGWAMG